MTNEVCPTPPQHILEEVKKSKYGGTWFAPEGPVFIYKDGKYGWLVEERLGGKHEEWKKNFNKEWFEVKLGMRYGNF